MVLQLSLRFGSKTTNLRFGSKTTNLPSKKNIIDRIWQAIHAPGYIALHSSCRVIYIAGVGKVGVQKVTYKCQRDYATGREALHEWFDQLPQD